MEANPTFMPNISRNLKNTSTPISIAKKSFFTTQTF